MKRWFVGVIGFLAIGVAIVAPLPWLFGWVEPGPELFGHLFERFSESRIVFLAHVVGGGIALLAAPWQLSARLRRRVSLHRATGYLYVAMVALAGTAGLVMAPRAFGGPIAQIGFTALALGWLATTALGLQRILAGDRVEHRAWMTRSFALAFAAVSLRLQLLAFGSLGVPLAIGYPIVAWSCWVPNLLVVHFARRKAAGDLPVQRRNARVNELCSENPSR